MTTDPHYWHQLPSAALRPFIDRYWGWDIPAMATLPMLMPGTGSECFFHYRQPPDLISGHRLPESYLVCPRQQTAQFLPSESLGFIAIRFKNGQLRHFTDRPFIELQDAMPPLRELWGEAANRLDEQLWAAPNQREQILLIERFLLTQLNYHHQATAQKLDRLMEQIYYAPNNRIETIADATGWSHRHLERNFKQAFALTPKRFARLARLHHTLRQIALQPQQALLDIALERGFSDQSHFIHDVQLLIGMKPLQLQQHLRETQHYYNLPSKKPD